MDSISRRLAFVGLAQFVALAGGFLALGISMKMWGYPDNVVPGIRWRPMALFLRENGSALLLVVAAWIAYAVVGAGRQHFVFRHKVVMGVGLAIAAMLAGVFLLYAASPYTRPFLIYVGE